MKNQNLKLVLISLGLVCAFFFAACGADGAAQTPRPTRAGGVATALPAVPAAYAGKVNPLAGDAAAIEAGKAAFEAACVSCHGAGGLGDGAAGSSLVPKPANLVEIQKVAGDDFLFWRVSRGKEGTSMVAWENVFNEKQIWQLVAYLRTLK